jgi:hypothetical protein
VCSWDLAPGTDVVKDHCSAKTTHQDDGFIIIIIAFAF